MPYWRADLDSFIIIKWPFLSLVIFFALKSTFSDINIAPPGFFSASISFPSIYLYLCVEI